MIKAPKRFSEASAELWHLADDFIEQYNRFDLVRMSEADLLLAATIVATARSSWLIDETFRLDQHAAKSFGTTTTRLGKIFPTSWYKLRDDGLYNVRFPAEATA